MKHDFYDVEEVDECLDSDGIDGAEEGFMKGYLEGIQGIYTYRVNYIKGPQPFEFYGDFN